MLLAARPESFADKVNACSKDIDAMSTTTCVSTRQPRAPEATQLDAAFLAEAATEIRRLGKTVIADVIEIGRLLTRCKVECKERYGHGHWLPWLDREFGWTDRTALNFMRVYAMSLKSEIISDLDLSLRDLYRLAAPSTPEEARTEVIERIEAGEHLDHDDIASIIELHGEKAVLHAAKQLRAERTEERRAEKLPPHWRDRQEQHCARRHPLSDHPRRPGLAL